MRYKIDCIENERKGVTNNTNNWDSNRTNMSKALCPAALSHIFVKNTISMSDNMASNGIMTREKKGSKRLPKIIC
jgi:hypothetical protein